MNFAFSRRAAHVCTAPVRMCEVPPQVPTVWAFLLKSNIMMYIYWVLMCHGNWPGPRTIRQLTQHIRPFFGAPSYPIEPIERRPSKHAA